MTDQNTNKENYINDRPGEMSSLLADLTVSEESFINKDEIKTRLSKNSYEIQGKLDSLMSSLKTIMDTNAAASNISSELTQAITHLESANRFLLSPSKTNKNYVWRTNDMKQIISDSGMEITNDSKTILNEINCYRAHRYFKKFPYINVKKLLYPEFYSEVEGNYYNNLLDSQPDFFEANLSDKTSDDSENKSKDHSFYEFAKRASIDGEPSMAETLSTLNNESNTQALIIYGSTLVQIKISLLINVSELLEDIIKQLLVVGTKLSSKQKENMILKAVGSISYIYTKTNKLLGYSYIVDQLLECKELVLELITGDDVEKNMINNKIVSINKKAFFNYKDMVVPELVSFIDQKLFNSKGKKRIEEDLETKMNMENHSVLSDLFSYENSTVEDSEFDTSDRNHQSIDLENLEKIKEIPKPCREYLKRKTMPTSSIQDRYRIRILSIQKMLTDFKTPSKSLLSYVAKLFVHVFIFYGNTQVHQSVAHTRQIVFGLENRWDEFVEFPCPEIITVSSLPSEARLCFLLCGQTNSHSTYVLSFGITPIFDFNSILVTGVKRVKLRNFTNNELISLQSLNLGYIFRSTPSNTFGDKDESHCLLVEFPKYKYNLEFIPEYSYADFKWEEYPYPHPPIPKTTRKNLKDVLTCMEPIDSISYANKIKTWEHVNELKYYPSLLPVFLLSVNWVDRIQREKAYHILKSWQKIDNKFDALELLDFKYPDTIVRKFAVESLRELEDMELKIILPQLVQALKFENNHNNTLSDFLLERGVSSPYSIGYYLYWQFKIASEAQGCELRFKLYGEDLLYHLGFHSRAIYAQTLVASNLQSLAEFVVNAKQIKKREEKVIIFQLRERLSAINANLFEPNKFLPLPVIPTIETSKFVVDKCKFMSSKKSPLFLTLDNIDPNAMPKSIIYKIGDDLRQDELTISFFNFLDYIWRSDGLNLSLLKYRTLPTGLKSGMIEVVEKSETLSDIQQKYGGGAMGALKSTPLMLYLKMHNKTPAEYAKSIERFITSCAGYVIATYILGVGDRHAGNIMLTNKGVLFHIDFGHFLGNFKKKFGFNRERSAFVMTKDMAFLMGGVKYKKSVHWFKFQSLCMKALLSCRKRGHLIICMFKMMVDAGLPELSEDADLSYLKEMLCLDMDEKNALKTFNKQLERSISNVWRTVDNYIHNLKHASK